MCQRNQFKALLRTVMCQRDHFEAFLGAVMCQRRHIEALLRAVMCRRHQSAAPNQPFMQPFSSHSYRMPLLDFF